MYGANRDKIIFTANDNGQINTFFWSLSNFMLSPCRAIEFIKFICKMYALLGLT